MDASRFDRDVPPETTETAPAVTDTNSVFTIAEWCSFLALRRSYQPYYDTFNDRELAHLRFLRWLHQSGKLAA